MTPTQRALIERILVQWEVFGLTSNVHEAVRAQRDALETAEARVQVLQEQIERWEKTLEAHGHRVDHPTAEQQ